MTKQCCKARESWPMIETNRVMLIFYIPESLDNTQISAEAPPSDQALSGPEILLVWLCYKGITSVIRTINTSPLL